MLPSPAIQRLCLDGLAVAEGDADVVLSVDCKVVGQTIETVETEFCDLIGQFIESPKEVCHSPIIIDIQS